MNLFKLTTPVAFFIFNRPETSKQVFEQIRRAKPEKLLVIADGPRPGHPEDVENCSATRAVVNHVDWNCGILTKYSDVNLGCKICMSSGIDWIFNNVEEAIILEHDTLPHLSFFQFAQELLEQYLHDERIMTISGCNFQFGRRRTDYSYYFSRCVHCWGWATWRRAWQHYDVSMALWPEVGGGGWLESVLGHGLGAEYWHKVFELTHQGYVDTWDYQWVFNCWSQNGLSILPNGNLVSNIGFGTDATHTKGFSCVSNLPTEAMSFPLRHPPFMLRDVAADHFTQELYNSGEM